MECQPPRASRVISDWGKGRSTLMELKQKAPTKKTIMILRSRGTAAAAAFAPTTTTAASSRRAVAPPVEVLVASEQDNYKQTMRNKRSRLPAVARVASWWRQQQQQQQRERQQERQRQRVLLLLVLSCGLTTVAIILLLVVFIFPPDHVLHHSLPASRSFSSTLQSLTAQSISSTRTLPLTTMMMMMMTTVVGDSPSARHSYDDHHYQEEKEQPCRYDGHCPVGTTCAVAVAGVAVAVDVTARDNNGHLLRRNQENKDDNQDSSSSSSSLSSSSVLLSWPGRCRPISIDTSLSQQQQQQQQQPSPPPVTLAVCVEACRAELQLDEHFYHQAWPDVLNQYSSSTTNHDDGRPPNGCVLIYKRQHPENPEFVQRIHALDNNNNNNDNNNSHHPSDVAPSIQNWTQKSRFRHIVRVDPAPRRRLLLHDDRDDENVNENVDDLENNKKNDHDNPEEWMAYCTSPCRDHVDCQPLSSSSVTAPFPFVCQDGACQRKKQFWEDHKTPPPRRQEQGDVVAPQDAHEQSVVKQKDNVEEQELVIVTGADYQYFGGLVNLIKSVQYWAPHVKMVVYNLGGWSLEQVTQIRQEPNVLSLEWTTATYTTTPTTTDNNSKDGVDALNGGIPSRYPDHVKDANLYAWKPIIIQEALAKYKMIFWLDAGSTLTGSISPVIDILKRTGIFLVKGQDMDMARRSSPLTYEWFNVSKASMKTGPHFSGNTQAYLSPSRYVESIVNLNAACALDPDCINPPRATLGNHRYDQTSLSICAYQPQVQAPHYTEYLANSRNQLPAGFPLDEAAFRFIWTSRLSSQHYSLASNLNFLGGDNNLFGEMKRQRRKKRRKKSRMKRQ